MAFKSDPLISLMENFQKNFGPSSVLLVKPNALRPGATVLARCPTSSGYLKPRPCYVAGIYTNQEGQPCSFALFPFTTKEPPDVYRGWVKVDSSFLDTSKVYFASLKVPGEWFLPSSVPAVVGCMRADINHVTAVRAAVVHYLGVTNKDLGQVGSPPVGCSYRGIPLFPEAPPPVPPPHPRAAKKVEDQRFD